MRAKRYPKGASEMLRALGELRGGAISFNQFELRTRLDWTRIARELHSRWPLPPAVSVDDVRQELLLAVVVRKQSSQNKNLLEKWDPRPRKTKCGKLRRTELDEYVVWNARVGAARWIHAQRGAKRNRENGDVAGKIRGTFYPVLSSLAPVSDRSDTFRIEVPTEAVQEQSLILEEGLRRALSSINPKRTRELAAELLAGKSELGGRMRTGMVEPAKGSTRVESGAEGAAR